MKKLPESFPGSPFFFLTSAGTFFAAPFLSTSMTRAVLNSLLFFFVVRSFFSGAVPQPGNRLGGFSSWQNFFLRGDPLLCRFQHFPSLHSASSSRPVFRPGFRQDVQLSS